MIGAFVPFDLDKAGGSYLGWVICENGCWEWTGYKSSHGYGRVVLGRRAYQVHRVVFERLRHAIPKGLELDHLCKKRDCVNPAHLEPVTHRENLLRGDGPTGINSRKRRCPAGHSLHGRNLYITPSGQRKCRACKRALQTNYRRRKASECLYEER